MGLGLTDNRIRKDKMVKVSQKTINILNEHKKQVKDIIGKDVSNDDIIRLALNKPSVIILSDKEARKKKRLSGIYGEDLGVI